jgi:hypothetical protein
MWVIVKKLRWQELPYVLMYLSAFMMIGLFDFVDGKFDASQIVTVDYWRGVVMMVMASVLFLLSAANRKIGELMKIDEDVKYKVNTLEAVAKSQDLFDFDDYLLEKNKERKRLTYINLMKKKIDRLENGIPWLPFVNGAKTKDKMIYNEGTEQEKANNRYCIKRAELDYLISDAYIDKTIRSMNIKYPELQRSFVTVGYESLNSLPWITESKTTKMLKDLSPRFLFTVGAGAFIASFIPGFAEGITISLLFGVFVKFLVLIANYIGGLEYAPQFIDTKVKVDLQYRYEIVLDYDNWRKSYRKREVVKDGVHDNRITE